MPAILIGALAALCGTALEDDEAGGAGCRGVDVAIVRSHLPEGCSCPVGLNGVVGDGTKVLVVGHALPHGVVVVALAQHGHLHDGCLVALGYDGAVVDAGEEEVTVVDAVSTYGGAAGGLKDLGEVAVRVKLQDILHNGGVGRVGTEIDVVAEGDGHALELSLAACPYHLELACLAIVGDDVGTLADVVAQDVAVGHGINHGPESVHRHAGGARDGRAIEVDQRAGDVACGGDVDFVAAHGQSPGVAVLAVAAGDETVSLSLAPVGVGDLRHSIVAAFPESLSACCHWQGKHQSEEKFSHII